MVAFCQRIRTRSFSPFIVAVGLLLCSPASGSDTKPSLTAAAYLVIHNSSGKPLLAQRANDVRSIASLTKLLAALTVRAHHLKLDQPTTITRDDHNAALGGCRTRLELNWSYRNRDLLHAALMASDNRAVSALGRAVGLNANALVQAMNEFARAMGLTRTQLSGPVGIDHDNVSTAWEISRIVRRAAKDDVLSAIMSKSEYRVKPVKGYLAINYRNTNPAVGKSKRARFIASKTGFNDKAGYCLATVAETKRLGQVTIVLLGSKSKYARIKDLNTVLKWLSTQPRP